MAGGRAMVGKVVMVTGANAGMGRQVSLELARSGATVVMVCRSPEKGEEARSAVQSVSGNAVELLVADMSLIASVRELARAFAARHDSLHALVNNVGVTLPQRSETAEGIESTFA